MAEDIVIIKKQVYPNGWIKNDEKLLNDGYSSSLINTK